MPVAGSDPEGLRARLTELLSPVVADHGADLVDVEVMGARGGRTLRLLVYREAGTSVEVCEAISREVADLLDLEDPLPGRYRLEVTSPGLDRPLVTDGDFNRASGRRLRIILADGGTLTGRLVTWDAQQVELDVAEGRAAVLRSDIARATIEVEF